MDSDFIVFQMEKAILGSTKMIKKKGMEYINGQMVKNIMDGGKMENKRVLAFLKSKIVKTSMDFGKKEQNKNGFQNTILLRINQLKMLKN